MPTLDLRLRLTVPCDFSYKRTVRGCRTTNHSKHGIISQVPKTSIWIICTRASVNTEHLYLIKCRQEFTPELNRMVLGKSPTVVLPPPPTKAKTKTQERTKEKERMVPKLDPFHNDLNQTCILATSSQRWCNLGNIFLMMGNEIWA